MDHPPATDASDDGLGPIDNDVALGGLDFCLLSLTDFEEFCFDLMAAHDFTNVDWRKETPPSTSPSDHGSDIVAARTLRDVDAYEHHERWFVDCKHYKRGVPPDALQNTIAWANAERPDVVLFIASGYLTSGAKDWLDRFRVSSNLPSRIRVWGEVGS